MPVASDSGFTKIEGADQLETLVSEARTGGIAGIDTEFLREKTYRARLCLLQVSTREGVYIIDPLNGMDLAPIAGLVGDPDVEVVVHAGRQDFEIFAQEFGVSPTGVFDTQIAAGFAGYGASLPYGRLVQEITGAELAKAESYTDWCKRPLTEKQMKYAANDVRYLIPIADKLKDELVRDGRIDWIADEMAYLEDASLYSNPPLEAWKRVSGRGGLSGRQQAILRELAAWREEAAARRNIPRGWVVKDQSLVEVARRSPDTVGALKSIRGFPAKEAERSFEAIRTAIDDGNASDPITGGKRPSRTAQARARTLAGLADAIVRSRAEAAGIATELVATRSEMEALLMDAFGRRAEPNGHRLLQGWRRHLVGDAIVALAEGRIAVRSTDKPPYIEEVPLERSDDHGE